MKHALIERSTPEQNTIADEAADWMLDAMACATQDRRWLRGEPEYDTVAGDALLVTAKVACLRSMHKGAGTWPTK